MGGGTSGSPPPETGEIVRKAAKGRIEQLAAWNDHSIERGCAGTRDRASEELSNQPFGPVPLDRAAKFPRGDDSEPRGWGGSWYHQQREETALDAKAAIEYPLELGAPTNTALFRKARGPAQRAADGALRHGRSTRHWLEFGLSGQALGRVRPPDPVGCRLILTKP
jgi:hypothetical protein